MKKYCGLLSLLVALGIAVVGCDKAGKLDDASTFKTPSGPMMFRWKWIPGETIRQEMEMKMTMKMGMPGADSAMATVMTVGQGYEMHVVKALPDGGSEVEMEFLRNRMAVTAGGKTNMQFDSDHPSDPKTPDSPTSAFSKLVGTRIRYFFDSSNHVEKLEGVSNMIARLSSGAPDNSLAMVKGMYSDDFFKQMMSQNLFLPPKPVQVGDTWQTEIDVPMGPLGKMAMAYDFTFKDWEIHGKRNCAKWDFNGTMKIDPSAGKGLMDASISSMDGTSSGSCWFDPEFGLTVDTTIDQDIHMVMSVAVPGSKPQTMTNDMSQLVNIKVIAVK